MHLEKILQELHREAERLRKLVKAFEELERLYLNKPRKYTRRRKTGKEEK